MSRAYSDTSVPIHKTLDAIKTLLRKAACERIVHEDNASQQSLFFDSQFRDVAEAVDGAQGMINGCARLNGLHNGLAVEFLTELAEGFGVDNHIKEMNDNGDHADSLARIRQLVANEARQSGGKGRKNGKK